MLPACCQRSFLQRCSTRPQAGVAEHIAKQRPHQRPEFIKAQSTETSFSLTEVNEVNLETSVIIQRQTMIHNDIMFVSSRNRGSPCVTHAARWPAVPDPRVDKCLRQRIPESHVHGPRTEAERKPSPHWCGLGVGCFTAW